MLQPLWIWAILGLALLSVELLTGTFYILWFGISALGVALLLAIYPTAPFSLQLLSFSILSLTALAIWRRKYRTQGPASRIGQSSDDTIGKRGRITEAVSPSHNGSISFTVPVMSSRVWMAISDDTLEVGETAEVTSIEGNYLRVRRVSV